MTQRDWNWHKEIDKKCLAPWHSLTINWQGNVFADAVAKFPYGNLYENTLSQMWESDRAVKLREDWSNSKLDNPICSQCMAKETSSGYSRRLYFYNNMDPEIVKKTKYDPNASPDILYLEINSSNKCNLKCRMCCGPVSSSWIKDEVKLASVKPYWMPKRDKGDYFKLDFSIIENLLENKNYFLNLEVLKLTGGEPLMEEQNYQIMEKFIEWGIAKNVTLDINTNGTVINERLKNIAKEFKTVKFHVSIEGTGKLYEYIRGGDNFDIMQLEDNIKNFFNKLPNTTLIYTVTVQINNIFDLVNIWKWYLKNRKPYDEIYFRNIVANPRYLNIHVLPQEYKSKAYEILKNADLPIGDYFPPGEPLGQGDIGFKDLINNLAGSKHYTESQQQTYLKEFLWFTKQLDDIRNTSIEEVVPELKDLFNPIAYEKIVN